MGVFTGAITFFLDFVVEKLCTIRWYYTEQVARNYSPWLGLATILAFSFIFVLSAALLSLYIAPAAIGSGMKEAVNILHGVA